MIKTLETNVVSLELIDTLWNVNWKGGLQYERGTKELIDTLWNVNSKTVAEAMDTYGINRYIMECKLWKVFWRNGVNWELIDTLWNVNTLKTYTNDDLQKELIDTLWNVNLS